MNKREAEFELQQKEYTIFKGSATLKIVLIIAMKPFVLYQGSLDFLSPIHPAITISI